MNDCEKYEKVFKDIFPNNAIPLGEGFSVKLVPEWDSVSHLSLISALEDAFDVMLETDEILHFGSYENGKNILRKYGMEL